MDVIEIIGDNYNGSFEKTRIACRAVIVSKGEMLLSYAKTEDTLMIPGGGVEKNETYEDCCIREVSEETGYLIEPSECLLELNEYYEDCRYKSLYYLGKIVGKTEPKPTEAEKKNGLISLWLPVNDAVGEFSKHALYADTDEMKRGLYFREYTALRRIIKGKAIL